MINGILSQSNMKENKLVENGELSSSESSVFDEGRPAFLLSTKNSTKW